MSRTWTMDELITVCEAKGIIQPPFTQDERSMAWAVAAAWHFSFTMQELPGRCHDGSTEHGALLWGIDRVQQHRTEQATGQAMTRGRGGLAARPSGRVHAPRRGARRHA